MKLNLPAPHLLWLNKGTFFPLQANCCICIFHQQVWVKLGANCLVTVCLYWSRLQLSHTVVWFMYLWIYIFSYVLCISHSAFFVQLTAFTLSHHALKQVLLDAVLVQADLKCVVAWWALKAVFWIQVIDWSTAMQWCHTGGHCVFIEIFVAWHFGVLSIKL